MSLRSWHDQADLELAIGEAERAKDSPRTSPLRLAAQATLIFAVCFALPAMLLTLA